MMVGRRSGTEGRPGCSRRKGMAMAMVVIVRVIGVGGGSVVGFRAEGASAGSCTGAGHARVAVSSIVELLERIVVMRAEMRWVRASSPHAVVPVVSVQLLVGHGLSHGRIRAIVHGVRVVDQAAMGRAVAFPTPSIDDVRIRRGDMALPCAAFATAQ